MSNISTEILVYPALNRTKLELKLQVIGLFQQFSAALNRTKLELKLVCPFFWYNNSTSLNRTKLELKLFQFI